MIRDFARAVVTAILLAPPALAFESSPRVPAHHLGPATVDKLTLAGSGLSGDASGPCIVTNAGNFRSPDAARAANVVSLRDQGAALNGTTDDTAKLLAAVSAAGASKTVLIDGPAFLASPASVIFSSDSRLEFSGNGCLITAFGAVTGTSVIAFGAGYTSIPAASITGNATLGLVVMGLSHAGLMLGTPGTGYVPGDVLTLQGGTGTPAALTISATQVVSATVASSGTGGADGNQTVTGTTGYGIPFQASVTVSGGRINAINSITHGGTYQRNPADLSAEPVTGAGLSGAKLAVTMGVGAFNGVPTAAITAFGAYTKLPRNAISLAGGSGTGATLSKATWNVQSIPVTSGGSYPGTTAPIITLAGGSPATAARVIAMGEMPTLNGSLTAPLKQIFAGYGYVQGSLMVRQIEALWFGADPTGAADSSPALRRAAHAVPPAGGTIDANPGTYLIGDTIYLKSRTILRGEAGATIWKTGATMEGGVAASYTSPFSGLGSVMVSNVNFKAPYAVVKVDRDITVRDMVFDYTALKNGGTPVVFRMAENLLFEQNRSIEAGSANAFLASDNYTVRNNYTFLSGSFGNAGHDQWEGPKRGKLINNTVVASPGAPKSFYSILMDGVDTKTTFGIADDILISGNTIYGFRDAGILSITGGPAGQINNVRIIGNSIDCGGNPNAQGISLKGFGSYAIIADNRIANCNGAAVVTAADKGGTPSYVSVVGNHVVNPMRTTGTGSAVFRLAGAYSRAVGNLIEPGGTYDYGFSISGANSAAFLNSFQTGSSGRFAGGSDANIKYWD